MIYDKNVTELINSYKIIILFVIRIRFEFNSILGAFLFRIRFAKFAKSRNIEIIAVSLIFSLFFHLLIIK